MAQGDFVHQEVRDWFDGLVSKYSEIFIGTKVLEAGSHNINGSVRKYFSESKEYVGVDWRPGPDVDYVSLMHKYDSRPNGYFDVVVSTSFLEHDPYWKLSLARMLALLRDGGALIVTCAGPEFPAHEIDTAPDKPGHEGPYYRGIPYNELIDEVRSTCDFSEINVGSGESMRDTFVLFAGKNEASKAQSPEDQGEEECSSLTSQPQTQQEPSSMQSTASTGTPGIGPGL